MQRQRGFSLMELLIAMAIFSVLGAMAVLLMNRGMDIFQRGTKAASVASRKETVLPLFVDELVQLAVVDNSDPPPVPRDDLEDDPAEGPVWTPPPPVGTRLLCTRIRLRDEPEGPTKDLAIPFIGFVKDISEGLDPVVASLPLGSGEEAKPITPATVAAQTRETVYQPPGGRLEVVYIAIPENRRLPSILTLYRGYRAPVADPEHSLLNPENLDTLKEIRAACRPVAEGILHLGATWRRVFATSWDEETRPRGSGGELTRYVGPRWDSTRALDKGFALFKGLESLHDPSDDVFPKFVRLQVTMANRDDFGFGRGDLMLEGAVNGTESRIKVDNPDALLTPGLGRDRWLKIGTEWMAYTISGVLYDKREVRVVRGQRGTKAVAHDGSSQIYIGEPTQREMELPLFRDRFTLPQETVR